MKSCLTCPHPVQNLRTYHARDRITGEVFEVEECLACALSRTRVPEDFDAGKYYPPMYYGLKNKRFVGAVETAIRMFRHRRARQLQRWSGLETGRVLDIGCANGTTTALFAQHVASIIGADYAPEAIEIAGRAHPLANGQFRVMDVLAIDVRCPDIAKATSLRKDVHILELNATPGITLGMANWVADAVWDALLEKYQ